MINLKKYDDVLFETDENEENGRMWRYTGGFRNLHCSNLSTLGADIFLTKIDEDRSWKVPFLPIHYTPVSWSIDTGRFSNLCNPEKNGNFVVNPHYLELLTMYTKNHNIVLPSDDFIKQLFSAPVSKLIKIASHTNHALTNGHDLDKRISACLI